MIENSQDSVDLNNIILNPSNKSSIEINSNSMPSPIDQKNNIGTGQLVMTAQTSTIDNNGQVETAVPASVSTRALPKLQVTSTVNNSHSSQNGNATSPSMRTCHHASLQMIPKKTIAFTIDFAPATNSEKQTAYALYRKYWLITRAGNRASGITRADLAAKLSSATRNRLRLNTQLSNKLAQEYKRRCNAVLLHNKKDSLLRMDKSARLEARQNTAVLKKSIRIREQVQKAALHAAHVRRICLTQKLKKTFASGSQMLSLETLRNQTLSTLLTNRKQLLNLLDNSAISMTKTFSLLTLVEDKDITELKDESEQSSPCSMLPLEDASDHSDMEDNESIEKPLAKSTTLSAESQIRALIENGSITSKLPYEHYKNCDNDEFAESLREFLPPINRFTLRELELDEFLSNAQLRHDLYFNADIHFKPNVSGEKGMQKVAKASAFWSEFEIELSSGRLGRLPLVLQEIKTIIYELIPISDTVKSNIEEHFDMAFICAQLEKQSYNPYPLVSWLGDLLKQTCAPARDPLVDEVVQVCADGSCTVTRMLRMLFNILEIMKLDCANHLLEKLRPFIVSTAFAREWQWFQLRYKKRISQLSSTVAFFEPFSPETFNEKVLELIASANMFSTGSFSIPETFQMDATRMIEIYNDIQDIGVMASLIILFKQACRNKQSAEQMSEMKKNLWVLLNDPDISIWNVVLEIARVGGSIRGSSFSEQETQMLNGLVESTLNPKSKLFEVVKCKIRSQIIDVLNKVSVGFLNKMPNEKLKIEIADNDLAKSGLLEMKDEVLELATKTGNLVHFNKGVYGKLYNNLHHHFQSSETEVTDVKLLAIVSNLE